MTIKGSESRHAKVPIMINRVTLLLPMKKTTPAENKSSGVNRQRHCAVIDNHCVTTPSPAGKACAWDLPSHADRIAVTAVVTSAQIRLSSTMWVTFSTAGFLLNTMGSFLWFERQGALSIADCLTKPN